MTFHATFWALAVTAAAFAQQDPTTSPTNPSPTTTPPATASQPPAGAPGARTVVLPRTSVSIDTASTGPVTVTPIDKNQIGETVISPRIRSITRLHNSMPHQLIGIGLVTGLPAGTGSSDRGTRQAILNVVRQLGVNLTIADVIGGTTALVSLTCTLPPFAKQGMPLDVKVEIISDAKSLRGGELLRAELKGVDGQVYVVAQGALVVAGVSAGGQNATQDKNPSGSGWLPNGGLVVREENSSFFSESGALELTLMNPGVFNSASVAAGARTALAGMNAKVTPVDGSLVRIELPEDERTPEHAIRVLNLIGDVRVAVENPTKVLIDQVSGTVLAGEGVLISPCVVGLSELTISVSEAPIASQPNAFGQGTTERLGRTSVEVQTNNTELKKVGGGATVADLLTNLKMLGLTPAQLVSVFQALDQGGFLHATLEVR